MPIVDAMAFHARMFLVAFNSVAGENASINLTLRRLSLGALTDIKVPAVGRSESLVLARLCGHAFPHTGETILTSSPGLISLQGISERKKAWQSRGMYKALSYTSFAECGVAKHGSPRTDACRNGRLVRLEELE